MKWSRVRFPLHSKVSRKTNIKGYRLGEATWWQTRTPPKKDRDYSLEFTESFIKGMFHKFGFLISEVMIQRKFGNMGKIMLLGKQWNKLVYRRRKRSLFRSLKKWERKEYKRELRKERLLASIRRTQSPKLAIYIINYIKELIQTYLQYPYNISYREVKKIYQESDMLYTYITKSKQPMMKMMRRVQKRIQLDSRRRIINKRVKYKKSGKSQIKIR